jgi:hypothetical protein
MMKRAMGKEPPVDPTRRALLRAIAAIPMVGVVACADRASGSDAPLAPTALNPTPACGDDDDGPTPSQTEGPYFASNSPERQSLLESGMAGTVLERF